MEQLIIRPGASAQDAVHWIVWSKSEDDVIASGELPDITHLTTLKERAGERPVVLLVPSSQVLLKWVALPPKAGRKVLGAIPFMLEDDLAEDINQLFFAYGPKEGDQQAVAIVRHEQISTWQSWLADAGLYTDRLLPDVLALPYTDNHWSMLQLSDDVIVRQDKWQGIQGESGWLIPALAHMTKQQTQPVHIDNYTGEALYSLTNIVDEPQTIDMPMVLLAKGVQQASFNLLQGDYKIRRKQSGWWYQWRLPIGLAALVLISVMTERAITLYQLKSQNAALSAQISATVKRGFPNIGVYRDVRRKVSSEIAKLEQGGNGISFLVMMSQLSNAFSQSSITPQTLRFDANRTEIRLQAEGKDFGALETFKRVAEQSGFSVEQGAINNRDDKVIGTMAIRSAS